MFVCDVAGELSCSSNGAVIAELGKLQAMVFSREIKTSTANQKIPSTNELLV